jgi:type VI secretion system protein ImpH
MGKRLWDRQSKFRVVIGPVDKNDMQRLLPGTASHRRFVAWVDLYTGGLLEWDMELQVARDAAACMRFDGRARLAYTSWLGRKAASDAPSTVRIQPHRNNFTKR